MLCRVLGVSRSGYYAWLNREPSKRDKENLLVLQEIREVYLISRKAYGSPRVHAVLKKEGFDWGRHRIASDDEDILTLALVTKTRLLLTEDDLLIDDFGNHRIINNPRGKIFTQSNILLLKHYGGCLSTLKK